ncbi:1338_t:CDS:2 [Entrophospora sp. SA101]|nr:1338_t:CDS:2 [Entrophospora sp. SA101]CAJ0838306.1 1785_t:CDS:2 [Entrophospora sp. SA101]
MSLIAVAQFCASIDTEKNLEICTKLLKDGAQRGAKMIFFPEASDFITSNSEQIANLTSLYSNNFVDSISNIAKEQKIWVSICVHETSSYLDHVYNAHLLINSEGIIIEKYYKLHLYDVEIRNELKMLESKTTLKGEKIIDPVTTPLGKIGLMICYDLRFPELSLELRKRGSDILTYPSAFTVKTGQAHWEVLLRARAIETQTYVVASAQIGQHDHKRASFGNAMIIDPWGTVLARCPDTSDPSIALAEIDLNRLNKIRREMPVLSHRRTDLFN